MGLGVAEIRLFFLFVEMKLDMSEPAVFQMAKGGTFGVMDVVLLAGAEIIGVF